jgi:hypothetical protein
MSWPIGTSVTASHTRAVLSSEAVTTGIPSGLNATPRKASSYYKGLHHFLHCHLQSMHACSRRVREEERDINSRVDHPARGRPGASDQCAPWARKHSRISSPSSIK